MNNRKIILDDLKQTLQAHYGTAYCDAILFGSQIKPGASNDSDYDVLIVLDKNIHWKDEDSIYNLCFDLNLKYDIVLDIHLLSKNDIKGIRGRQPIYVNALKSGIHA